MFRKSRKKRAQSTAEYAIIIAIVVGAVVAMQVYVKRGLQARIHDVVDSTGGTAANKITTDQGTVDNPFSGDQYEPYYAESTMNTSREATSTEALTAGGGRTTGTSDITIRTGTQRTGRIVNEQ